MGVGSVTFVLMILYYVHCKAFCAFQTLNAQGIFHNNNNNNDDDTYIHTYILSSRNFLLSDGQREASP